MPIYEYECAKCGYRFEVRQHFNDDPIAKCQHDGCKGPVHRVFSPPTIIFKGNGFYTTDYARGGKGASRPATSDDKSTDSETAGASKKSDSTSD